MALAPAWYEALYSGGMSPSYKTYMANEWGHPKRGDVPLFEKLCLEGAQAGLSWATILSKREAYRKAFAGFDIAACAAMTDKDIERLVSGDGSSGVASIVRHRGKIAAVAKNAQCVQALIAEAEAHGQDAPHGHFDAFLWSFVGGAPVLNAWPNAKSIPSESAVSITMSKALKERGFAFVGPKTCYSLMQSCGLIVDHPKGTPEWQAAKARLELAAKEVAKPAKPAKRARGEGGTAAPAATSRRAATATVSVSQGKPKRARI
jgi:DNA-3-methyladenine glycosylase I